MVKKLFDFLNGFRKDDWMHFTVSLLLAWLVATVGCWVSGGVFSLLLPLGVGVSVSMAVGIWKEARDSLHEGNALSTADLLADFAGAIVGAVMGVV